jgi:glycosyltransferase involved in cell wall biosynthesis
MKKVLFLSPLPPPYYGSAMSSEMCLKILKNSKEFQVRNIKLNYSKEMSDVGKINLDKIKGIFKVKKQIKKQIREFDPEIIYFMPATSGFGLIRDFFFIKEIKKHFKRKILFHIRSRTIRTLLNNFFYRKMFIKQKAIVLGEALVRDVSTWIKKEDILILPNAIKNEISDFELKKILKERRENKNFNILFLSNMDKTKGWPKLLEACKILNEKDLNFNCDFVGAWQSNQDEKYFYDFIKKNNLEKRVFAHGRKTGKRKEKFLKNANVFVFPTEYKLETFGRVIIEAMMFGLPVIANGIASIPEIIQENKTGFVLKENTGEEISIYLEKIYKDKNSRENMGKQGRKRFLEEFELRGYKSKFEKILEVI